MKEGRQILIHLTFNIQLKSSFSNKKFSVTIKTILEM